MNCTELEALIAQLAVCMDLNRREFDLCNELEFSVMDNPVMKP